MSTIITPNTPIVGKFIEQEVVTSGKSIVNNTTIIYPIKPNDLATPKEVATVGLILFVGLAAIAVGFIAIQAVVGNNVGLLHPLGSIGYAGGYSFLTAGILLGLGAVKYACLVDSRQSKIVKELESIAEFVNQLVPELPTIFQDMKSVPDDSPTDHNDPPKRKFWRKGELQTSYPKKDSAQPAINAIFHLNEKGEQEVIIYTNQTSWQQGISSFSDFALWSAPTEIIFNTPADADRADVQKYISQLGPRFQKIFKHMKNDRSASNNHLKILKEGTGCPTCDLGETCSGDDHIEVMFHLDENGKQQVIVYTDQTALDQAMADNASSLCIPETLYEPLHVAFYGSSKKTAEYYNTLLPQLPVIFETMEQVIPLDGIFPNHRYWISAHDTASDSPIYVIFSINIDGDTGISLFNDHKRWEETIMLLDSHGSYLCVPSANAMKEFLSSDVLEPIDL